MILIFEEWISRSKISDTGEKLFKEAIICYKASAYKAALVFSYLGFFNAIKDNILYCNHYPKFKKDEWEHKQKELLELNQWEDNLYNFLLDTKTPIFELTEDAKNQIVYWKNRKNDCIYPSNITISSAHIETFWIFIQSYLPQLILNSKDELIHKIQLYFNAKNFKNMDYTYFIQEIPHYVKQEDLQDFFEDLYLFFSNTYEKNPFYELNMKTSFFKDIFSLRKDCILQELILFLRKKESFLIELLITYPNIIIYFLYDKNFVQSLWQDKLFNGVYPSLNLYCHLLKYNAIPKEKLDEVHLHILKKYNNEIPQNDCIPILEENNFFEKVKSNLCIQSFVYSNWANSNKDFLIFYLDRYGFNENIVEMICLNLEDKVLNEFYEHLHLYLEKNKVSKDFFSQISKDKKYITPTIQKYFNLI